MLSNLNDPFSNPGNPLNSLNSIEMQPISSSKEVKKAIEDALDEGSKSVEQRIENLKDQLQLLQAEAQDIKSATPKTLFKKFKKLKGGKDRLVDITKQINLRKSELDKLSTVKTEISDIQTKINEANGIEGDIQNRFMRVMGDFNEVNSRPLTSFVTEEFDKAFREFNSIDQGKDNFGNAYLNDAVKDKYKQVRQDLLERKRGFEKDLTKASPETLQKYQLWKVEVGKVAFELNQLNEAIKGHKAAWSNQTASLAALLKGNPNTKGFVLITSFLIKKKSFLKEQFLSKTNLNIVSYAEGLRYLTNELKELQHPDPKAGGGTYIQRWLTVAEGDVGNKQTAYNNFMHSEIAVEDFIIKLESP